MVKFSEIGKTLRIALSKHRIIGYKVVNRSEEMYSNLALVISDQCSHTTKVAVFADETNTEFRDSKEFGGSIFEQLDSTFAYLALCNKTTALFKGLERIEKVDYPEEALREALLNALVHCDYSFRGSIIINVNDKEIEFISIGGLLPGLSTDDVRSGISQPRNKNLADIFHRLHLIESYGTGIRKIYKLYVNCSEQPKIEVTSNTFKIILPNMNRATAKESGMGITAQMQKILDYIDENGKITDLGIQDLLGFKKTRAFTLAKQMRDEGLITVVGRGNEKKYIRA